MSDAQSCSQRRRPIVRVALVLTSFAIAAIGTAPGAFAALAAKPTVPAGVTISKLAGAPKGALNCDDLAFLEGHLFMDCQNKALSNGGGGNSTLAEYGLDGSLVRT